LSRLPLLTHDQAPPLTRGWYRPDGTASALTRSLASAPDVMETLMPFLGQIMSESSLDLATKELITMRVSHINGCRYCLAAHHAIARDAGLTDGQLDEICGELPPTTLDERQRAIITWVDRVASDAASISDALVAATLDWLRDDQLVEVTILVGAITMLNQYCTALAIPPPRTVG
jgi:AhpD family alkylhydroperoxidase